MLRHFWPHDIVSGFDQMEYELIAGNTAQPSAGGDGQHPSLSGRYGECCCIFNLSSSIMPCESAFSR